MSKLAAIETFTRVVELKNYANAAKKLDISAVAVGKQIKVLEKQLGVQLFDRTARYVALTEPGKIFYEYCQKILFNWQEAETAMANLKGEPSGQLRIFSTLYLGEYLLTPKMPEFIEKYPKIDLNIELADRYPNMEKEDFDLLFGIIELNYPNLIQRKIMDSSFILCAAPSYLKKYGTPKIPKDLLKHRYIAHNQRNPDTLVFINQEKIKPTPILSLNHSQAMLICALKGLGIVNLHYFVAEQALKEGKLVKILADQFHVPSQIYLFYKQSNFLLPKIRAFVDFITSKLK